MLVKLPFLVLLFLFFQPTPFVYKQRQQDVCAERVKTAKTQGRIEAQKECETKIDGIRKACEEKIRESKTDCEPRIKPFRDKLTECETKLERCLKTSNAGSNCCNDAQGYKKEIENLHISHRAALAKLSAAEKAKYDGLWKQYNVKNVENKTLLKKNKELLALIGELEKRLGNKSIENADLFEKSKKIESEIEKLITEIKEKPVPIFPIREEMLKTVLAADDIANKTKANMPSVEYRTVTENGKTYQIRELMIGTLLFPSAENLTVEPNKPLDIEVIFRPNALLKNSSTDGNTKWYLEFAFAPDKIKDFSYDEKRSKDTQKRVVGDEVEEVWIWKADKLLDNFSSDKPRIQIDGSVEIDGREISKTTVENKQIEIKEKPITGFLASIVGFFKNNLTTLLAIATSAFGLGIAFLGYQKAIVDKEKSQIEMELLREKARNEELQHQIEKTGETENSTQSRADLKKIISSDTKEDN